MLRNKHDRVHAPLTVDRPLHSDTSRVLRNVCVPVLRAQVIITDTCVRVSLIQPIHHLHCGYMQVGLQVNQVCVPTAKISSCWYVNIANVLLWEYMSKLYGFPWYLASSTNVGI